MPTQAQIARRYTERALHLIRVANGQAEQVRIELRKLAAELRQLLASTQVDALSRREVNELLREIDAAIAGRYAVIAGQQVEAAGEIIEIEADWAQRASDFRRPASATAIAATTAGLIVLGHSLSEHWQRQQDDLRYRVSGAVREVAAGQAPGEGLLGRVLGTGRRAQETGGIIQAAARNADALVHTTVSEAATDARMPVWKANGVNAFRWHAVLDEHTTAGCALRHGLVYTLDTLEPIGHNVPIDREPPRHYRCLLGDSRVLACGQITGVSERRYDGDILIFRTASGNELSVTPNHPILTDRGWLAAHAIDVGGSVISSGLSEWILGADANGKHVPPTIEEVARALRGSIDVLAVPVPLSAEDFHGDGAGSEVAVIWADRRLGDRINAAINEHPPQDGLIVGTSNPASPLSGDCGATQALEAVGSPALGSMCGAGIGLALGGSHAGSAEGIGFTSTSQLDIVSPQDPHDRHGGNTECLSKPGGGFAIPVTGDDLRLGEGDLPNSRNTSGPDGAKDDVLRDARLARDLRNGLAGPVFLDAVVDKRRTRWSGHVYNLETTTGAYIANGIINHNCRSILLPMAYADDIPIPEDGGESTFREYFDSLDEAQQDRLFDAGRARLFREGVITQADLVGQQGQILSLRELRESGRFSAYDEAVVGGQYSSFLADRQGYRDVELERSARSYQRTIEQHEAWIENPFLKVPEDSSPEQIERWVSRKWPSDIARNSAYLDIVEGILRSRRSGKP